MASEIHPLALVDPAAELGEGVRVGPFAVVEGNVSLGEGTVLEAHAVVLAGCRLGRENRVHSFAVLGGAPQHRRDEGRGALLVVGDGNVFREHATAHRGTEKGGGATRIGSGGLFMAGSHVGHDARVGDSVTLANGTLLGGHVSLGDGVTTGGQAALAPFVRVGRLAFIAGGAMVERDVPPFVIAAGDRARVRALNAVGLERAGVPASSRLALRRAFRALFLGRLPRAEAARALEGFPDPFVRELARACSPGGAEGRASGSRAEAGSDEG